MTQSSYIGIDPGMDGGLALLAGDELMILRFPEIYQVPGPLDLQDPSQIKVEVFIEDVAGFPGDTPNTAFKLGMSSGWWQCFIYNFLGKAPVFVPPQKWQTRFARSFGDRWCPKERKARKTYIHEHVKKIFPDTKITKPLADAVALAWLGREGKLKEETDI